MRSRQIIYVVLFCIILTYSVYSRVPPKNPFTPTNYDEDYVPDYYLTKDEIKEDIKYLIYLFDNVHSNAYRKISRDNFFNCVERIFKEIENNPREDISVIDAWYYYQELTALLSDGHTEIYYPVYFSKLTKGFFPLEVYIFNGKIFVKNNAGDSSIPNNAEILSINDILSSKMLSELSGFISSDTEEYKKVMVEYYFNLFLQTYYKLEPPWNVEYKFAGQVKIEEVTPVSYEKFDQADPEIEVMLVDLSGMTTVKSGDVVFLTIPDFSVGKKDEFEKYFEKFFRAYQNSKYLIIDLRNNTGGDAERAAFILKYLFTTEFKLAEDFRHRVSPEFKRYSNYITRLMLFENNVPRLFWWVPYFRNKTYVSDFREIFKTPEGSYHILTEEELLKHPVLEEEVYKGKIFVLISERTFSSGVLFASVIKYYGRGYIIGRETGTVLEHSANPLFFELPNSKLRAVIPVSSLTLLGKDKARGVIPDIKVQYTEDETIRGLNKEEDAAIKIILEEAVNYPKTIQE
mgnify:CR=1 FL=1